MLKFHAADRKLWHKPFLILRDCRLIFQKMYCLLNIQTVFHDHHHRIRKPDQRPCVGVHGRLNHCHLGKSHRTTDQHPIPCVEHRPFLQQRKSKILEQPEKNHISQRIPADYLSDRDNRLSILLFQQTKYISHPYFLGILAQMNGAVHIVRHSLKYDIFPLHAENPAVQHTIKDEIAENRKDNKQRRQPVNLINNYHPADHGNKSR